MSRLSILFVCCFAFVSCRDNNLVENDYSYISDPRARWRAYNLTNYIIEQDVHCFCKPYFGKCFVYVQSDTVSDVINIDNSTSIFSVAGRRFRTVNQLFELIDQNKNADQLDVEYNHRYGYPSRVFIDYFEIVDEELSIVTQNLKPIK
ncbi:MAG: DUF6174 domain-containing protein [Bacteroidota bacterium]|nr:DUF6174 domain-containing protein [Bacteroidota bacterium]